MSGYFALAPADEAYDAGKAAYSQGDLRRAEGLYRDALARDPDHVASLHGLGVLCVHAARFDSAVEFLKRAHSLDPGSAKICSDLAVALNGLDRHEEAAALLEHAIALAPEDPDIHLNYGTTLTFVGHLEMADAAFARAAEISPDAPAYRCAVVGARKVVAGDLHLEAMERMASSMESLQPREQAELHIALSKAYDDLERFEDSFRHLSLGNAIVRRLIAYDQSERLGKLRELADTFSAEFLAANAGNGYTAGRPIFVVGMPRSGSTLVEQILASHPNVFGAGERLTLANSVAASLAGQAFPAGVSTLRGGDWRRLGRAYAAAMRALAQNAERTVDKMLGNFAYIGAIHLALPNARIVHIRRDPVDTCFSCYSKFFKSRVDYAYDLTELGTLYRAYAALMDHWRQVLPERAMLEVDYESLVCAFDREARRLVEYCGLEWDERCLAFHENRRAVLTASAAQVRRPIYRNSLGRSMHYSRWLGPLFAALSGSGFVQATEEAGVGVG